MKWLIILAAAGLVTWLYLRRNSSEKAAAGKVNAALKKSEFHGISINPGEPACDAARQLLGKRFLANQAPELPLAECDATSCSCHYIHHEDRRSKDDDRRASYSMRTDLYGSAGEEDDRRSSKDRRKS